MPTDDGRFVEVLGLTDGQRSTALFDESVRGTLGKTTAEVQAEVAEVVLKEGIRHNNKRTRLMANGYSSMRWLWLLRRWPRDQPKGAFSPLRCS